MIADTVMHLRTSVIWSRSSLDLEREMGSSVVAAQLWSKKAFPKEAPQIWSVDRRM